MAAEVRPFLRWAGSKRKLVPRLSEYWDDQYKRYVEPFAGSSCLFLALQPECGLLADNNRDLIATYEVVKESPEALYRSLVALPRNKSTYYHERSRDPARLSEFDRAVRFVYLNRNCFNGIYRTNKDGHFNVPFSADRTGAYFTLNELIECSRVLQNAELRAWDFGTTLRYVKEGDFVYLDPPFAVSRRRVFREYGVRPFDIDDVDRLGTHLRKIADRGADFLVSYADSSEARELARPWRWRRVPVRRHIAGFGEARKRAYELMITNIDRELVANEP